MSRILCLWFPNWPVQRLQNARPELKRRRIAIYEQRQGLRVVASNDPHIRPGTPLAEAAGLVHETYDPLADRETLARVAEWCEQFSPIVALEEIASHEPQRPECLLLDITGLGEVFQSETALLERIYRAFIRRSLEIRLAIADTLGMAWGLAHFGEPMSCAPANDIAMFAALPVAALRLPLSMLATLRELGIHCIGQLLNLPRESLVARFGHLLVDRIAQALGEKPELVAPHRALPEISVERQFEFPLEKRATIEEVIGILLAEITATLNARQQGAVQLECVLRYQNRETRFIASLFEASSDAQHLFELLRMRLERVTLPDPVDSLSLSILLSARLLSRQRDLFEANQNHDRELALLIDRLSGRLGRESVVRPLLVPDAQPEYAYRCEALAGKVRKTPPKERIKNRSKTKTQMVPEEEQRPLSERPLILEPRPLPLEVLAAVAPEGPPMQFRFQGEVHRTHRSWGPERIQTGWWRNNYIRRDYYRVESEAGRQFWLFRSRKQWFLHGIFD